MGKSEHTLEKVGEIIKREREAAKLSQSKLMGAVGRSPESYRLLGKWEKGIAEPLFSDMLALCNVFGCELAYLLGEQDCKTRAATDIHNETGLSEAAILLLSATHEANKEPIDDALLRTGNNRLYSFEAGRYAKIKLINSLIENSEIWEELAVCAYSYDRFKNEKNAPTSKLTNQINSYMAAIESPEMVCSGRDRVKLEKGHAKDYIVKLFDSLGWYRESVRNANN